MAKKKLSLKLKFPKKLKVKVDKRLVKPLLILLVVAAVGGLLYNIKSWFIVAIVNGRPISRLALDHQLEAQYGQATLENEIIKNLILQTGKKENVNVTQAQVDERVGKIEAQFTAQGTDLDSLLASQGQTRQDLEEQLKVQLIVEGILGGDIKITDEQIKEYYETNKDFFPKDAVLEDLKEDIRQDVFQQQMGEKFKPWLEELKKEAKIYYFLKF